MDKNIGCVYGPPPIKIVGRPSRNIVGKILLGIIVLAVIAFIVWLLM